MVEIRKYLGIFPLFGGIILLFSIFFPAAIYDTGYGYLEIMVWGWYYRETIWSYGIGSGFIRSNLVMGFSITWTVGLVICGIIMIITGLYFIYKLSIGVSNFKFNKVLEIICGIIVIVLPILWMIAVDSFYSTNSHYYIEAGLSFLRDLNPYGPTICSFIIGPLNILLSVFTPSKRS